MEVYQDSRQAEVRSQKPEARRTGSFRLLASGFWLGAVWLCAVEGRAIVIDRIAAVVEQDVITLSEIDQLVKLRFFERNTGESEDGYRRRVLETMIAQALRFKDVQRFGGVEVSKDAVEARLLEIQRRFPSPAAFEEALRQTELTLDEARALITRQLQLEEYIEERISPLIFVPLEQIEAYYRDTWAPQRTARGLELQPLSAVREEIRSLLKAERLNEEIRKWTEQLRSRVNVDIYAW